MKTLDLICIVTRPSRLAGVFEALLAADAKGEKVLACMTLAWRLAEYRVNSRGVEHLLGKWIGALVNELEIVGIGDARLLVARLV